MRVYYGWQKPNKIAKRDALCVYFLNVERTPPRINKDGKDGLTQKMYIFYERRQTKAEAEDAKLSNRIYTVFYIFMDDKKIGGSLERALEVNFQADGNNVSKTEKERIREALRDGYMRLHPHYVEPSTKLDAVQLSLF